MNLPVRVLAPALIYRLSNVSKGPNAVIIGATSLYDLYCHATFLPSPELTTHSTFSFCLDSLVGLRARTCSTYGFSRIFLMLVVKLMFLNMSCLWKENYRNTKKTCSMCKKY